MRSRGNVRPRILRDAAEGQRHLGGVVDVGIFVVGELESPPPRLKIGPPTAEMKTSFFRPGMPGRIKGVGKVVRWGSRVAFTEGELFDAEGRLLAKATGTAIPTPFQTYKK